jgi:hypothetical protein
MTVCPSCGFRNEESESFCRNPACTAFLGWAEERVNAERRATARDAATGDSPSSSAPIEENTQPFDVTPEARRSDPAAGMSTQTRAGSPSAPPPRTGSARPSESPPPGVSSALRGSPASGGSPAPGRPAAPGSPASPSWSAPPSGPTEQARPAPPSRPVPPSRPAASGQAGAASPPGSSAAGGPPTTGGSGATGGTSARPETTADPFATGPFAPGRGWQPEWQAREPQRPGEPAPRYEPPGEWGRGVYSQGRDPATGESGRRVLSAAETAWGTRDFVQRPREQGEAPPPPAGPPGAPPPAAGTTSNPAESPSYESAWPTADPTRATRARRSARPAAGPPPRSSFPSESALLKQPPLWERLLRRTRLPVPGEGSLRRAPSARERERRRALLRFAVLVLIIVLVGSGLWIASTRKPAETAGGDGGNNPGTAAPALVSVRPGRVQASTQSGSRVATNVLDGKPDTYWSRSAPSDDDQPFLRFFFNGKVKLARISVASGAAGSEYSRRPRPRQIELRFSDNSTVRATLADRASFQTVSFPPREVDALRLVVLSTYPSAGPQRTSINEIRFLAVKS